MTSYFHDTFTDTNGTLLTAHAPDVGTGWSNSTGGDAQIQTNQATNASFSSGNDIAAPGAASADYQVSATLIAAGGTGAAAFLLLRDTGGGFSGYMGGWNDGPAQWQVVSQNSGITTVLGTSATNPVTDPSSHTLVLAAVGTTITLSVDGTVLVTVTDATWALTGFGGVDLGGTIASWLSFDDFDISDVGGGGGGTVHSGLTGTGSFVPSGDLEAIEVDLDVIPAGVGTGLGNPLRYFEIGNVSFEYGGSYSGRNYYLEHQHEIVTTQEILTL